MQFRYLMVMLLMVIQFIGHGPPSIQALTCLTCTPEHKAEACQQLTAADCPHGITIDMCGCCDACYKGLDEECGGIWNQGGSCAETYSCSPNPRNQQLPGKCIQKSTSK